MKKFLEEFKAFAMRGNVIDMAVGVIIGGAFQGIVTALIDNIITPLLNAIGADGEVGGLVFLLNGQEINVGAFLTAILHFLIMAFILFMIVKTMNTLRSRGKSQEPAAPATKICPYCMSEIHIDAVKCPHCASDLKKK